MINNIIIIPLIYLIFVGKKAIELQYNRDLLLKIKNFEKRNNISNKDIEGFRRINSMNILLDNKKKYHKTEHPIISVILIVYNQFDCIHKAIRSIQNQSVKNLEIIAIDDCSSDNSVEILKKYQKEDNRIIIIIHKTNQGKIKSRSDGIKKAKGKYITVLDGDDGLIHKDILNNSLYVANIGNLDVVEFKIIPYKKGKRKKYCLNKYKINTNNIIYQPKLRTIFFSLANNFKHRSVRNRNICGKIIKNQVFKEVLNRIGPKFTEDYILDYEDTIMTVALFQVANSYYYMKEEGYYYSRDDKRKSLSSKINKNKPIGKIIKGMDPVKFLQFLIEKTRNNKIEKQLVYHETMSVNYHWNFYNRINHDFQMIYYILDKLIKSRFLSKDQKHILISMKKRLKEKESLKNI
jgi:glycosyltransferase involved in cell wall biosynthesis